MPISCTDATAQGNAAYGRGPGPIVLDDVACVGTESNILSCPFDRDTSDCQHSEDAGVTCVTDRKCNKVTPLVMIATFMQSPPKYSY